MRRPPRHVDEDRERAIPQLPDDDDDEAKLDWCSPERSWSWLLCLGACIFYFAYQSEPPWPDPVGDPSRPRTLAAYDGPSLRVSEAVNRYVASLKPEEELCSEDMWLRTLSKKCGANVKKEELQDTCCAFKDPFPEVALLTGARKKNLMVPNEEKRKAVAAKPLWGFRHDPGADAVMGLGFYPSVAQFQYFVGSLRKTGFRGDIVMAVGPRKKLKRKVEEYLRNQRVLSYPFEYSCSQKGMSRRRLLATPGGCVLDDWYVDGDARGPRPLALARYEMYETWLRQYSSTSYALVLDTRDTFFQRDPSLLLRPFLLYNLRLRAAASSRPSLARVLRCRVYGVGAAHTPSHHRDALVASMAYELYHTLRRGSTRSRRWRWRRVSLSTPSPRRARCRHAIAATPSAPSLTHTQSQHRETQRRFAWPDLKRRRRDPDHAKDLYVYEENGHKTVGSCRWNRGWLKGCFPNMPSDPSAPVRCSGSTMGSRDAMLTYVDAMLAASDEFMCHRKGIPSDQGYHNFLILSGRHEANGLRVVSNKRGEGVVHTIGALNGGDVPMSELGPLDTKWKIRDSVKGYITNVDGSMSPVVHQWDRWASEMSRWLDSAFVRDNFVPGERELFDRPPAFVDYDPSTCTDMPWKSAHRSSCAGLRAEHHDWVSSPPERRPAKEACCKFGGGIKTG